MRIIDCRQFTKTIVNVAPKTFEKGLCVTQDEFLAPPDAFGNRLLDVDAVVKIIEKTGNYVPIIFDVELESRQLETMAAIHGLMGCCTSTEYGFYNAMPTVGPDTLIATKYPYDAAKWLEKQREIDLILNNVTMRCPSLYNQSNPDDDARVFALIAAWARRSSQATLPFVSNRIMGEASGALVPKDQLWNTLTACKQCFNAAIAWTNFEVETDPTFTQCLLDFAHM